MKTHTHNETTKAILTNPEKVRDLCRLTLSTCWHAKVCGAVNIEFEGQHFTLAVSIIDDGKGVERTWINDAYMVPAGKMTWLLRDGKMKFTCVKADAKKEKKKVKREHESLSDDELQDYYANALATRRGAGGHGKAHYNGLRVDAYLAELNARGQKPDGREGSFNGIGSY